MYGGSEVRLGERRDGRWWHLANDLGSGARQEVLVDDARVALKLLELRILLELLPDAAGYDAAALF